jgi:hypothetical protein
MIVKRVKYKESRAADMLRLLLSYDIDVIAKCRIQMSDLVKEIIEEESFSFSAKPSSDD